MSIFKADSIIKQYGEQFALNKVSIEVPENSIFGLLGPNGAGKTTLIRIINQIIAPDSGMLFFDGQPLKSHHVAQIGYLPEERGLYKKMKVGEQAVYLARLKGISKHDALSQLKFWFAKFEIESWWNKKVEELSKGMQQKVQFIVTVLHKPKLLIFDEPFSGFDPINTNMLKKEIINLKNEGSTIIFSTHNMGSVEELCDHISLIHNAETILEGEVENIKNQHKEGIYQVEYHGKPEKINQLSNDTYRVLENIPVNYHNKSRIKINEGGSLRELLNNLMSVADINAFREEVPSMDDIFIKVVKAS